jgi:hypothetical protein
MMNNLQLTKNVCTSNGSNFFCGFAKQVATQVAMQVAAQATTQMTT